MIRPPKKGPLFQIFLNDFFCKAPTGSFRQNGILGEFGTVARRSRPFSSSRLSPPEKGPSVSYFSEHSIFVRPGPVAFTSMLFWLVESQWLADLGPPSVLDYPPPRKTLTISDFSQPSIFQMPRLVAFTRMLFWWIPSPWLRDLGPPCVLDCSPPRKGSLFHIFLNQAFL